MLLLLNLLPAFRGAKEVEGSVECSLPAPSRGSWSAAERDGRSSPAWRPTDDFDPPPPSSSRSKSNINSRQQASNEHHPGAGRCVTNKARAGGLRPGC